MRPILSTASRLVLYPIESKSSLEFRRNGILDSKACLRHSMSPIGTQAVDKVASCRFRHCVIPAEAGIQTFISRCYAVIWIPASAGMTSAYLSCMFTKTGFVNTLSPIGTAFQIGRAACLRSKLPSLQDSVKVLKYK